jgi:hypothetical protein
MGEKLNGVTEKGAINPAEKEANVLIGQISFLFQDFNIAKNILEKYIKNYKKSNKLRVPSTTHLKFLLDRFNKLSVKFSKNNKKTSDSTDEVLKMPLFILENELDTMENPPRKNYSETEGRVSPHNTLDQLDQDPSKFGDK